jgi:hypothetical protein
MLIKATAYNTVESLNFKVAPSGITVTITEPERLICKQKKARASPASCASYCYHAIGGTNTQFFSNRFEPRFALSARFIPVGFDYLSWLIVNQVDSDRACRQRIRAFA